MKLFPGLALLLAFSDSVTAAEEKPDLLHVSDVVSTVPSFPLSYRTRWLPEEGWRDAVEKLEEDEDALLEGDEEPKPTEGAEAAALPLLRKALEAGERKYVDNYFYDSLLPNNPREVEGLDGDAPEFPPEDSRAVVEMVTRYLARLEKEGHGKSPAPGLAWHGMAVADRFMSVWQQHCKSQKFTGAARMKTELVWRTSKSVEGYPLNLEYRAAWPRLVIMESDPWRVLDLRDGRWTDLSFPESVGMRLGIDGKGIATIFKQYDFQSAQWVPMPTISKDCYYKDINMDDPVRSGEGWVAFYENPPHAHFDVENPEKLTPEERRLMSVGYFDDRFHFLSPGQTARSIAPDFPVYQWCVADSGRLFVTGSQWWKDYEPCQRDEPMLMGADKTNRELVPAFGGDADADYVFNGQWRAWHGASPDSVLLDQSLDYAGRTPVRAALWDAASKKWELLWSDLSPQVPPPPPGVLEPVLKQTARWKLPRELTHPPVGCMQYCSPIESRKNEAFLLALTLRPATGTFTLRLWHFRAGRKSPEAHDIELPGFHPWVDEDEGGPLPHLHLLEDGFLFADTMRGQIWRAKIKSRKS